MNLRYFVDQKKETFYRNKEEANVILKAPRPVKGLQLKAGGDSG